MITVELHIPCLDTWPHDARLQIYTDYGTGDLDTDTPLLAKTRKMFPTAPAPGGFGEEAALGDGTFAETTTVYPRSGGLGDYPFGEEDGGLGYGTPYVTVSVEIEDAHGDWIFGAQVVDGAGNAQGAIQEVTCHVSGEEPAPLGSFAFVGFAADQCEFAVSL